MYAPPSMAVRRGSQCFRYPRRLPQRRLRPQWLSLTCPTLADDALVALGKVDVLFHLDDLPEPAMRQPLVTGGQYPGLAVLEPEPERDRRSVVSGNCVHVSIVLGGLRF